MLLPVVGFVMHIRWSNDGVNAATVALGYVAGCFITWCAGWHRRWIEYPVRVFGWLVIVAGWVASTLGVLGVAMVVGEMMPDYRIPTEHGLTVATYALGVATSDYRCAEIEVYRRVPGMPLLEYRIVDAHLHGGHGFTDTTGLAARIVTAGSDRVVQVSGMT